LGDKLAHGGLASLDFQQVESGSGEPAFQQAGAGSGRGAVNGTEQRSLARAPDGGENLEVPQRGGVEQQGAGAAIFLQRAEVLGLRAQILRGIVDDGPGGSEGGMTVGQAKTLQV